MDLPPGLVDDDTAARMNAPKPRLLSLGDLEPGAVGVIAAKVGAVGPVRTFTKKNGQEGMLRRVALQDATGEVDLVLWGDETRQGTEGPFTAGARVILRGATVKAGFREGVEVHLGSAVVEVQPDMEEFTVEGVLDTLGETAVKGTPPDVRFQAEAVLVTSEGMVHVVLWDEALRAVRGVLPGATVRIDGATLHPALEGWFIADGARVTVR